MSGDASHTTATIAFPAVGNFSKARARVTLIWFTFAISGFVLIEPAPFDFMVLVLIGVWLCSGIRLPPGLRAPMVMLAVLAVSGVVGAYMADSILPSGKHIVISIFLYGFTVAMTALVAHDPRAVLPAVLNGHMVAALTATAVGVIAYFFLATDINNEIFTDQGRIRGTFKDPNVFGPFLILPIVYWFLKTLDGNLRFAWLQASLVAFLCFGLLLSFSRGAWGNFGLTIGVATYLAFVTSSSNRMRIKVIWLTGIVAILAVVGLIVAVSFDGISEMMDVRARLLQSYDVYERFAGVSVAIDVILNNPFGIGSASFKVLHGHEPHNVYLYHFIIGGWVGGITYISLVTYTLFTGFRSAFQQHELRLFAILVFSAFLGIAVEGLLIDTDHWRNFYALMACVWGLHHHTSQEYEPGSPQVSAGMDERREPQQLQRAALRSRNRNVPANIARQQVVRTPVPSPSQETPPVVDLSDDPRKTVFGRRTDEDSVPQETFGRRFGSRAQSSDTSPE